MRQMRRWNSVAVVIVAIAMTALPLLHNHTAIPEGAHPSISASFATPCSVCATANARIVVEVPPLSSPLPLVDVLAQAPVAPSGREPVSLAVPRAPPAS